MLARPRLRHGLRNGSTRRRFISHGGAGSKTDRPLALLASSKVYEAAGPRSLRWPLLDCVAGRTKHRKAARTNPFGGETAGPGVTTWRLVKCTKANRGLAKTGEYKIWVCLTGNHRDAGQTVGYSVNVSIRYQRIGGGGAMRDTGLSRCAASTILKVETSRRFSDMPLPLRDSDLHTYGEYCGWPDDQRFELIDGVAYAMAPAPTRSHQRLVGELFRVVADELEGSGCEVNVAPFDVRLPLGDEADEDVLTVVQPDISVVCDQSKLDDKGCRGAPDWLIEVLSPGSAGHDQVRTLALYERHGVREHWLVHPVDRVVTIYRLEGSAYGRPMVSELQGRSGCRACPGVEVDWERVAKRLPATSGVG